MSTTILVISKSDDWTQRLSRRRQHLIERLKASAETGSAIRTATRIVQIVDGSTTLHLMTEKGLETHELGAGMLAVVPQKHVHRFHAPKGVSIVRRRRDRRAI